MANFIGMVYATLKNEGIDTSKLSTEQAVEKFKELQAKNKKESESPENIKRKLNGQAPKKETDTEKMEKLKKMEASRGVNVKKTPTEQAKEITKQKEANYNKTTSWEKNQDIDWDLAEENEKVNAKNSKNQNRTDKYGNALVSDEAFKVGQEALKSYIGYMDKYGTPLNKLKQSNVGLRYMQEIVNNSIINNGFNPNNDITEQDLNEIIGSVIGEEVNTGEYERMEGKGYTGKKYTGYSPR